MNPPLLECSAARIDLGGATLIDGLSFTTNSRNSALVGDWEPLFQLCGGRAALASGSVEVLGSDVQSAVRTGVLGLGLAIEKLPAHWSVAEYLEHSAGLAGQHRADARRSARMALERLGLSVLSPRKLGTLALPERRVLQVAEAELTEPELVLVELPLVDLDEYAQNFVAQVLERCSRERAIAVSIRQIAPAGPERNRIDAAEEVLVLEDGKLISQGPPAQIFKPGQRYRVRVLAQGENLRRLLEARGCEVSSDADGSQSPSAGEGALRLRVQLPPEASPRTIFEAAVQAQAPVVEMVPDA